MQNTLRVIKEKSWSYKNNFTREEWIPVRGMVSALCKPFNQLEVATRCAEKATPGTKYWGMSVEQIINSWNTYSSNRADEGVSFDYYTSMTLAGGVVDETFATDEQKVLFRNFDALKENVIDKEFIINGRPDKMQYLGSEIWVSSYLGIRGKMDSLFWFNNELVIFDWKTFANPNKGYNYMVGPLNMLRDSDHNKATLQLYLYKYIIEQDFGLNVGGVRIGQVNQHGWEAIKPTFKYDVSLMNDIIDYGKNVIMESRNK